MRCRGLQDFIGHQRDREAAHQARQRRGRATGCSTSSQPASASAGIARAACVSLHAMFTSTRTAARSPTARLISATWRISVSGDFAPIFSEHVVAALVEHPFGFGDVGGRVTRCERPCDRQAVTAAAAEQFAHRHAEPLAVCVEQRGFERALREVIDLCELAEERHQRLDARRILADDRRREIRVDRQLHRFGAFRAVRHAGDRRAFAQARDAVAAAHLHEHQRLAMHRGHRQLVRADRRQVDETGFDAFDGDGGHGARRGGEVLEAIYTSRPDRASNTFRRSFQYLTGIEIRGYSVDLACHHTLNDRQYGREAALDRRSDQPGCGRTEIRKASAATRAATQKRPRRAAVRVFLMLRSETVGRFLDMRGWRPASRALV